MDMMKAVMLIGAKQVKINQVPVPRIADDEVLIKVTACGVCGTDSFIYSRSAIFTAFEHLYL